ncbi:hypothetical protein VRK_17200 [Vibrio sp. MEBiC08052]|nr:hypothetical protein VRK_17200 [Vibrio sp. MEBiC08052]
MSSVDFPSEEEVRALTVLYLVLWSEQRRDKSRFVPATNQITT